MIIPVAALVAVFLPVLLGGRLRRLAEIRLRHAWTISTALITQIVVIEVLAGPRWLLAGAHLATYAAAAYFLLVNRRVPGLLAIGLGGASNGVAIALNGGTLPASAAALRAAGIVEAAGQFTNSGVVGHARLAFLGDVFAIPAAWPLSNVFSIGDVLIMLGVGIASLRICGTRWTPVWSPRAAGHGRPRHLAPAARRPAGTARHTAAPIPQQRRAESVLPERRRTRRHEPTRLAEPADPARPTETAEAAEAGQLSSVASVHDQR